MVHNTWFLDALKELSEFAKEEEIEGVLEGLSVALETYAAEAGVAVDQHDEILRLLGGGKTPPLQIQESGHQTLIDIENPSQIAQQKSTDPNG